MREIKTRDDLKHNDMVLIKSKHTKYDYATLHCIYDDGRASVTGQYVRELMIIPKEDIIAFVDCLNKVKGSELMEIGFCKERFIKF